MTTPTVPTSNTTEHLAAAVPDARERLAFTARLSAEALDATPALTEQITTAEELDALPVGSVVECSWFTWEDTARPFGEMTKPVSRLFMVTEHILVAERYEVPKHGQYGALARFPGGIGVVSRPDVDLAENDSTVSPGRRLSKIWISPIRHRTAPIGLRRTSFAQMQLQQSQRSAAIAVEEQVARLQALGVYTAEDLAAFADAVQAGLSPWQFRVMASALSVGPLDRPSCGHWVRGVGGTVVPTPQIGCDGCAAFVGSIPTAQEPGR